MIAIGHHVCRVIISKGWSGAWHVSWIKITVETVATREEQETGYQMGQVTSAVRPSTVYVRVNATRLHRVTCGEHDLWDKNTVDNGDEGGGDTDGWRKGLI